MRFDKEYHEYLQGNCKDYNQSLICALEEMEKEKAVFLGYQERVDGTSFLLVNEVESHSTVKYDEEKHELVEDEK